MNIDYKKLGYRLKIAREKKKLTQEQLAEKIGVSNNYISNIERSHSIPSLETIVKICNVLDITPDYLVLDSLYTSTGYLNDEISEMLQHCSPKTIRLISKVIKAIIEENESN
ncbi:helix-turn-helix domain-containing protein [Desulforamulus aquiferis]|uniref:Helix-turn-helix transcriptional regulator n=1 Tax=Desulforamulus aquiferis TaxID=1397668 RepID=A0AAW7ZG42_9FIRM|nr:helix-turn-helix transcriptional regulator [Desulforamulus aquiferis]MDO7788159.1 helix-turn-helix transcriptional regulator [Desulforamulus aquiferis]